MSADDDIRVINGYESTALEALAKGSVSDARAQIYAILHLADQVRRITDFFEAQERARIDAIYANARLGPH